MTISIIISRAGQPISTHEVAADVSPALYAPTPCIRADIDAGAVAEVDGVMTWLADPATILAAGRSTMSKLTVAAIDRATASILDRYPTAEQLSWPLKMTEARTVLAAAEGGGDVTSAIATTSIVSRLAAGDADLASTVERCRSIVRRGDDFAAISVWAEVTREAAVVAIAGAASIADLVDVIASLDLTMPSG